MTDDSLSSTGRSAGGAPGAQPTGPLHELLKGDEDAVRLVGEIFTTATGSLGIEGQPIFDSIVAGHSISEALSVPPEAIELLYARAHQCFASGRIDQAEQLFRSLCVLDGTRVDFYLGYGICLRIRDDCDAASVIFEMVALMRPQWAIPYYHLLELHARREIWDKAASALASYDARADHTIDDAMTAEVERLRAAIDMRTV